MSSSLAGLIPIAPDGKKALVKWEEFQHRSPTPDEMANWSQQFPGCNWALVTGEVSRLVVLDVDPRHGGRESIKGRVLPLTRTVCTPSGGAHYYFTYPYSPFPSVQSVLPGLDLKGDGGYILVPPSRINGKAYEVVTDEPIAPCPPWVLEVATVSSRARQSESEPDRISSRVPEGRRNTTLTSLAGAMRRKGASEPAILAALREENAQRCAPPLSDREVAEIVRSVARYPSETEKVTSSSTDSSAAEHERPQTPPLTGRAGGSSKLTPASQASSLVSLSGGVQLFHTPDGQPFASVHVNEHRETWPLHGRDFRAWMARRFHEVEGKVPGTQAMQDAISVLEGNARFEGPTRIVGVRLSEHEGAIYLDLANNQWQAVEITGSGWCVVDRPPAYFRRPRGLLSLPTPARGTPLSYLRHFVNIADEDWPLVAAWLVMSMRPRGPYPILVLHGSQGAAKSTTSRVLRALVDPNTTPLRAEPRDLRDLMIAAKNGWLIPIDNLSRLTPWLSDALCRLATGGGFATRELWTDSDETLFDAQRPVIINGIEEIATREDLIDRAVILYLPDIREDSRRDEIGFWGDFETARPMLLGALLDAVSTAMRNFPGVKLTHLPRMADFAQWAVAAAPGAGYEPSLFIEAYAQHRSTAQGLTFEASPVLPLIPPLVATSGDRWSGSATELLAALASKADEGTTRRRDWPTSPRELTNILRRSASSLRIAGVDVEFQPTRRKRLILLETMGIPLSPSSPGSPSSAAGGAR